MGGKDQPQRSIPEAYKHYTMVSVNQLQHYSDGSFTRPPHSP